MLTCSVGWPEIDDIITQMNETSWLAHPRHPPLPISQYNGKLIRPPTRPTHAILYSDISTIIVGMKHLHKTYILKNTKAWWHDFLALNVAQAGSASCNFYSVNG